MKRNNLIAYLAIVASGIIGSANGVAIKFAVRELDPLFATFLRCTISFIFIFPLFLREKKYFDKNSIKILMLSLISLTSILLYAFGIVHTTVSVGGILFTLMPILALPISYILLKERVNGRKIISIILGLIGAVLLILHPISGGPLTLKGSILGNSVILLSVLTLTLYAVLSKNLVSRYSPIYLITHFVALAAVLLGATQLSTLSMSIQGLSKVSPAAIAGVIFSGIGTVGFYVFFQYAIKHGSPAIATMNQYIQPAGTFILGALLLGDRLTLDILIGSIIVFTAAYLATRSSKLVPNILEPN